jgi:alcohol dehydrogenase class IV
MVIISAAVTWGRSSIASTADAGQANVGLNFREIMANGSGPTSMREPAAPAEPESGVDPFAYEATPGRVIFGWGARRSIPDEADRLGATRILVLSTAGQSDAGRGMAELLGSRAAGHFAGAVMHTPREVSEKALAEVQSKRADAVLAIGGGSTTGLGKAIAFRTDLPQMVVPTTYAGSEMTPILGETEGGVKTTRRDPKILPEVVIYDPELTIKLPPGISGTSGINAIAHAVEALYARDRNPIISLMSEEGIRALSAALPRIRREPGDREARELALYGAWLCGTALGAVGMALHHKLCHVLGGSFGLPHAETHSIVLPHAVAFNAEAAPDAVARAARALGRPEAALGLYDLARSVGAPAGLKDIGMNEAYLDRAADLAVQSPYWNPRPVERDAVRALLQDAWSGTPPRR